MASPATEALIRSLRGGRTAVNQGLQSFNTDASAGLRDLLAKQGLAGGQGAGLDTALAEQLRQQGQYQALDTAGADVGQNRLRSANNLDTASLNQETGLGLQELYHRGDQAESELRFLINRMKRNRATLQLLERIGGAAGVGAGIGSFGGPIGTGGGAVGGGVGGALSSLF